VEDFEGGASITFSRFLDHVRAYPPNVFLFSLLHGNEGEDGAWQGVAEVCDLKGTFGSVFASSVSMNKWAQAILAREICGDECKLPRTWLLAPWNLQTRLQAAVVELQDKPFIIKPNQMGASLLTELYRNPLQSCVEAHLREIFAFDRGALLQEYIEGVEYTVGCIELEDGIKHLPVISVRPERGFLGHREKHKNDVKLDVTMHTDDNDLTLTLKRLSYA